MNTITCSKRKAKGKPKRRRVSAGNCPSRTNYSRITEQNYVVNEVCRNRYSVLEDNKILDPNESNDNNVDELNESKRDGTQHKERLVNRDNAGGETKGKAELL